MKVAISVPDPLFEAAEKLAQTRAITRSKLYAEALSFYVSSHRAEDVTAQLNHVYGDTESRLAACRTWSHSNTDPHTKKEKCTVWVHSQGF